MKNFFSTTGHSSNYENRGQVLLEQIAFELNDRESPTVLDIGCGDGIDGSSELQQQVAAKTAHFWGVEPDDTVERMPYFDQVWSSTLEGADIPANSVDLAYSYMVLEHVESPHEFLNSLDRMLSPGGVFLSITVNANSLFGLSSSLCHWLKIEDFLLPLLRGKQVTESYHYPAFNRLNSARQFRACLNSESSLTAEFSYLENGEIQSYFKGALSPIGKCMSWISGTTPSLHTAMFVRLQKQG